MKRRPMLKTSRLLSWALFVLYMTGRCKGQEKPGSISEVKVKQNDHSTSKPTMAPADKKANVSKERLEKIRSQSPLKYENKTSSTSESLFHAQTYHDDELPHQVFDDEGIVLHDPYVTIDSKHHHHHKHKPEYHPPPHDHHDHHHHDHHDHNHYHHHRPKPAKYHKHVKKIDHHHIEPYPVIIEEEEHHFHHHHPKPEVHVVHKKVHHEIYHEPHPHHEQYA